MAEQQLTGHNKGVTTTRIGSFFVAPNGHWTMAAAAALRRLRTLNCTGHEHPVVSLLAVAMLREGTSGCVMLLVGIPSQQIQWQFSRGFFTKKVGHDQLLATTEVISWL